MDADPGEAAGRQRLEAVRAAPNGRLIGGGGLPGGIRDGALLGLHHASLLPHT